MYKAGDLVENLRVPQWGTGEILEVGSKFVLVVFEFAGQKKLSLSQANLRAVEHKKPYSYLYPHPLEEAPGTFSKQWRASYDAILRNQFKAGDLVKDWAEKYPQIFDKNDIALASGPQGQAGYHFVEWFTAVQVYEEFGLSSLVGKYECPSHMSKRNILNQLMSSEQIEFLSHSKEEFGNTQCPDLLVYKPDYSDYYFIEVKGPGDTLKGGQLEYFRLLREYLNKEIQIIKLEESGPSK